MTAGSMSPTRVVLRLPPHLICITFVSPVPFPVVSPAYRLFSCSLVSSYHSPNLYFSSPHHVYLILMSVELSIYSLLCFSVLFLWAPWGVKYTDLLHLFSYTKLREVLHCFCCLHNDDKHLNLEWLENDTITGCPQFWSNITQSQWM